MLKVEVWVRHAAQVYLVAWALRRAPARNVVLIFDICMLMRCLDVEQSVFHALR